MPPAKKHIIKGVPDDWKISSNVEGRVIVITEDKLKLCLRDYEDALGKPQKWVAPFGLFVTLSLVLLTADFKKFGFNEDVWCAILVIADLIFIRWLIISLINCKRKPSIDTLINNIKKNK